MSGPPGPDPERPNLEKMRDLLVLEGELSVATKLLLTLDIWVLQDYEAAERWTLRHRVTLPRPTDFGLIGMAPMMDRALSVGRNVILIACPSGTMATLYDLKEEGVPGDRLWGLPYVRGVQREPRAACLLRPATVPRHCATKVLRAKSRK
ncbi:hypothetical protein C2845_PM06G02600 [Panicum miliaceum]|uniref:Uncharacterized protein n=1 Tax=Panicum miliaceum TaxID=4540 RepID=A0A3L6R8K9_PANMI|nr:hypothetical protein C2845_PM06G02600 [Panicum miliaceum]